MNEELFGYVESYRFTHRISIQSGFTQVVNVLANDPVIRSLIREAERHPAAIVERIQTAIQDTETGNRDEVVVTYLYALTIAHPLNGKMAAQMVKDKPGLFYAQRAVRQILAG